MSTRWTIWLDGAAYGGEADEGEASVAPPSGGWNGRAPTTRSMLVLRGAPLVIDGVRNLASHVERIVRRVQDGTLAPTEITIRRASSPPPQTQERE